MSEEAQRRRELLESERLRSMEGGEAAQLFKTAAEQAQQVSFEKHAGRNKELEPLGRCWGSSSGSP